MSMSPTSPVTGGAQTGLTSPTYTFAVDTSPVPNGKAIVVTSLGGTQTGVDVSSASRPFSALMTRPVNIRQLPSVNPVTNVLPNVPKNTYSIVARKGVTPLSGQSAQLAIARFSLDVPAGADLADAVNVRALCSFIIGLINQMSAGIGDTAVSGSLG